MADRIRMHEDVRRVAAEYLGSEPGELQVSSVSGGDINRNYAVTCSCSSTACFVKMQDRSGDDFLEAEADGLAAIRQLEGAPRVPEVYATGGINGSCYLVMEYIRTGRTGEAPAAELGRKLAAMHAAGSSREYGYYRDNYIGLTPQQNTRQESWAAFFRDSRLGVQVRMAERRHLLDYTLLRKLDTLLDRLERYLPEPAHASLLHGDLWSGNWMVAASGEPLLIDPAVYYGHHEADIAMTELFGRFPQAFYSGYAEIVPLEREYQERRQLYNLYHLLNHLNMFGRSYEPSVRAVTQSYL